jgi:hypothetical protein
MVIPPSQSGYIPIPFFCDECLYWCIGFVPFDCGFDDPPPYRKETQIKFTAGKKTVKVLNFFTVMLIPSKRYCRSVNL